MKSNRNCSPFGHWPRLIKRAWTGNNFSHPDEVLRCYTLLHSQMGASASSQHSTMCMLHSNGMHLAALRVPGRYKLERVHECSYVQFPVGTARIWCLPS
jgi:hypothetical protein